MSIHPFSPAMANNHTASASSIPMVTVTPTDSASSTAAQSPTPDVSPLKATTFLRKAAKALGDVPGLVLAICALIWAVQSYLAAQMANKLSMMESCRAHPTNQALQSTPLCQEMRLIHDYDGTLGKRNLHHISRSALSAITGHIGIKTAYVSNLWVVFPVILLMDALTPGFMMQAKQANDVNESLQILFLPRRYSSALVRYCSRLLQRNFKYGNHARQSSFSIPLDDMTSHSSFTDGYVTSFPKRTHIMWVPVWMTLIMAGVWSLVRCSQSECNP